MQLNLHCLRPVWWECVCVIKRERCSRPGGGWCCFLESTHCRPSSPAVYSSPDTELTPTQQLSPFLLLDTLHAHIHTTTIQAIFSSLKAAF